MSQDITQLITKSALMHKRLMGKLLEPYTLTYAQYQVLRTIQAHEGLTAKDMLIYLDTDKATLSGVLKRLEEREMIKRRPDDMDRRLVHIHLSDNSRDVCEAFDKIEKQLEKELQKGLKGREIRLVKDVINQVLDNMIKKSEDLTKNH